MAMMLIVNIVMVMIVIGDDHRDRDSGGGHDDDGDDHEDQRDDDNDDNDERHRLSHQIILQGPICCICCFAWTLQVVITLLLVNLKRQLGGFFIRSKCLLDMN